MEPRCIIRLLLTGDPHVGKSSILLRFTNDDFLPSPAATPIAELQIKRLVIDDCCCDLHIHDAAVHEELQTGDDKGGGYGCSSYLRGAMGVAVVYDITSETSFANARVRMRSMRQVLLLRNG
jgi:GTPase SAR1 family protein